MSCTVNDQKIYVFQEVLTIDEDFHHEFKGHRTISQECMPLICSGILPGESRSRQPLSSTLNAFLNTGEGGTLYLGITDAATVIGIRLTDYQRDHVLCELYDVFNRYTPSVPRSRWTCEFVPVVADVEGGVPKMNVDVEDKQRLASHRLRTAKHCWCDADSRARLATGTMAANYVIEITIVAYVGGDLHPIYENEEDIVYMRKQASVHRCSPQEIYELTIGQVKQKYEPKIRELKDKLNRLQMVNKQ